MSKGWYPLGGSGGLPSDMLTNDIEYKRRLKVENSSLTTAHGELLIARPIPITQVSAEYGYPVSMLIASLGGSVTASDGLFNVSSGTGANNVAAAISARESNQRPGQGLSCIISAMFSNGVANSTQQAGFISSEAAIAFGYDGEEFGILLATGGTQEHQVLTVTVAASAPENATVTVDGVARSISLTASTTQQNAYEIAKYLEANEPRYRFTSNGSTVTALATLPDFGAGSFSFASATAAASWVQVSNGALPTEQWTPKSQWSDYPYFDIDPTKLNDYKIQLQGNIKFYIKNSETSQYDLVHTIKRINVATGAAVRNPTLRVGWGVRNKGNTTNITLNGVYASSFNEGDIVINSLPFSKSNTQPGVSTTRLNVLALRSRTVYRDLPNRAEILPRLLSFGTTSNKTAIFEVIANPTVPTGSNLAWSYLDQNNSIMEVSTNSVEITGGTVVATFSVTSVGLSFNINELIPYQIPFSYFSIAAKLSSAGTASEMTVNATWLEDK